MSVIICGDVIAFSSTRRVERSRSKSRNMNAISASVAPFSRRLFINASLGALGMVLVLGFQSHCRDIIQTKPKIDRSDLVLKLIAPGVALKRSGDRKAGLVEIVQQQQRMSWS